MRGPPYPARPRGAGGPVCVRTDAARPAEPAALPAQSADPRPAYSCGLRAARGKPRCGRYVTTTGRPWATRTASVRTTPTNKGIRMKILRGMKPERSRFDTIQHAMSGHAAAAGRRVREEFDDMVPKVTGAASDAVHAVTHTAAARSRPVRTQAVRRGSATLSRVLGEAAPAQIKKMARSTGRAPDRAANTMPGRVFRGRTVILLVVMAGGAVTWALMRTRSGPDVSPSEEEAAEPDPRPVETDIEASRADHQIG